MLIIPSPPYPQAPRNNLQIVIFTKMIRCIDV